MRFILDCGNGPDLECYPWLEAHSTSNHARFLLYLNDRADRLAGLGGLLNPTLFPKRDATPMALGLLCTQSPYRLATHASAGAVAALPQPVRMTKHRHNQRRVSHRPRDERHITIACWRGAFTMKVPAMLPSAQRCMQHPLPGWSAPLPSARPALCAPFRQAQRDRARYTVWQCQWQSSTRSPSLRPVHTSRSLDASRRLLIAR